MVSRVLLVVAMRQEATPLVDRFALSPMDSPFYPGSPMRAWHGWLVHDREGEEAGPFEPLEIFLVWCGEDSRFPGSNNVGIAAAAVATFAAITALGKPDLCLSVGTAGGFSARGAQIGDTFLSTKCVFHARRIPEAGSPGLEESGFGHFRSPALPRLVREVGIKSGVVSTSDSLDCSPVDLTLMEAEGAVVKEMEASAVAWVCHHLGVPFAALKTITDLVDGAAVTRSEFEANLQTASAELQGKLAEVLALLGGKPLSNWGHEQLTPGPKAAFDDVRQLPPLEGGGSPLLQRANAPHNPPTEKSAIPGQGPVGWGTVAAGALAGCAVFLSLQLMQSRFQRRR